MTYIKIVILDGLDVAMNPNVAVATAESDEQIREAEYTELLRKEKAEN